MNLKSHVNPRSAMILLFFLLCMLPSTSLLFAQTVVNPGFESGWSGWEAKSASGKGVALSSKAASGEKSAKLTEAKAFVSQVIEVDAQTSYELSALVLGVGTVGAKVGTEIFFEQTQEKSKEWGPGQVRLESGEHTRVIIRPN